MANIGKITQIIGPVVDVSFDAEDASLPNMLDSLEIDVTFAVCHVKFIECYGKSAKCYGTFHKCYGTI